MQEWIELFAQDAQPMLRDAIPGSDHLNTEYRILWSDGCVRHLRASARITRDTDGEALKLPGVNWDVT